MLKGLSVILCFALVSTVFSAVSVSANSLDTTNYVEIAPYMQNIQSITPRLEINNGAARMSGFVVEHMGPLLEMA